MTFKIKNNTTVELKYGQYLVNTFLYDPRYIITINGVQPGSNSCAARNQTVQK